MVRKYEVAQRCFRENISQTSNQPKTLNKPENINHLTINCRVLFFKWSFAELFRSGSLSERFRTKTFEKVQEKEVSLFPKVPEKFSSVLLSDYFRE